MLKREIINVKNKSCHQTSELLDPWWCAWIEQLQFLQTCNNCVSLYASPVVFNLGILFAGRECIHSSRRDCGIPCKYWLKVLYQYQYSTRYAENLKKSRPKYDFTDFFFKYYFPSWIRSHTKNLTLFKFRSYVNKV